MPSSAKKARVGEQNRLAVNEHRVVHRLDQALEELFAVVQPRIRAARDFPAVRFTRRAERPSAVGFALDSDASRSVPRRA